MQPRPLFNPGGRKDSNASSRLLINRKIPVPKIIRSNTDIKNIKSTVVKADDQVLKPIDEPIKHVEPVKHEVVTKPAIIPPPKIQQVTDIKRDTKHAVVPVMKRGHTITQHDNVTIHNCEYINPANIRADSSLHIYNDEIPSITHDGYKVLLTFMEPERFRVSNQSIIDRQNQFDLILAHDPVLLKSCRNAVKFPFGTTWLRRASYVNSNISKEFSISFLCGNKKITEGHLLRQQLWACKHKIGKPTQFWTSGIGVSDKAITSKSKRVLGVEPYNKIDMFGVQYHIAIENLRVDNYFSEKLIDCFVTKTIPIYWGAPNISEYFDADGIIQVSTVDDIISACNLLDASYYNRHLDAIAVNYEVAMEYCRELGERINDAISSALF